jgi:putative ABC transport system permease protein
MSNKYRVLQRLFAWSVDEIRQGQLWPVALSFALIIACIFGLSALAERMEQVIVKQGKDALTADTVFVSSNQINTQVIDAIEFSEMDSSFYTRFATMAFSDTSMQLVTVKAVDSNYPLRGNLQLKGNKGLTQHVEPGELWLDERIMNQLEIKIGDIVTIGDADLTFTGTILSEPGLSFNPFQQMPAAYIHSSSIDATGAVQLGSRVQFRVYLVGDDAQVSSLKNQIPLTASDRWRDRGESSRTNDIFDKTTQYLSLTVAIIIIMSAATLILTCQNYVQSRRMTVAMLKSLGASRIWLVRWLVIQISVLLAVGIILGLASGVLLEYLLRVPLDGLLPDPIPPYGLKPVLTAIGVSIVIGIPALGIPLYRLVSISSIEVVQRTSESKIGLINALVLLPLAALVYFYWQNTLVWLVLLGIVGLFFVLAIVSLLLVKLFKSMPLSVSFKLAISRINRSTRSTGLQYGALGLSLMLLTTIWLVRTDLLSDWKRTLPDDASNAFALNISQYDKDSYLAALDAVDINRSQAFPITRGRLVQINGNDAKSYFGDGSQEALSRELNFTYAEQLPDYNSVVSGQWSTKQGVSVETEVAESLNIKIGDELTFMINGLEVEALVNTIRTVEWRDMKPNFYFIFTPDVLKHIESTWLVSFRLNQNHDQLINELSRRYPTVSLMDIRIMGEKIQQLLAKIVWSITVLAGIGVLAGVLLIFTLLRLGLSQRQQEIRLYRTLGASRRRVVRTLWAEYGVMAVVAGVISAFGAELVVAVIMNYGFELDWRPHPEIWLAVPLSAFLVLAMVLRSLIRRMLTPVD